MEIGFSHCGIAPAHSLDSAKLQFERSIEEGYHAEMHFLERDVEKRFDPEQLLSHCQSVIVVALDYRIAEQPQSDRYRTARFTWVEDYHVLVKDALTLLVEKIQQILPEAHCRITVDSSCISEKQWAAEAGVGCYGKNGLIHNSSGSFFVLGTVLADFQVDSYDKPMFSDCADCRLCVEYCPANALSDPYRVDARRCYAYHTIENKNPDNEVLANAPRVFGCDACQEICPKNKKNDLKSPKILKSSLFLRLQNREVENLTKEAFLSNFGNTAIARRKYERFQKAIAAKMTDIQE